jgi:hypothetical protein
MFWCNRDSAGSEIAGATVKHIPLEELRAEAAEGLKEFAHVLVTSLEPSEGPDSVDADRRCWQACVRLRRVYGLSQAVILEKT